MYIDASFMSRNVFTGQKNFPFKMKNDAQKKEEVQKQRQAFLSTLPEKQAEKMQVQFNILDQAREEIERVKADQEAREEAKRLEKIAEKIATDEHLSLQEEMELQEKNPVLYEQAKIAREMKRDLENRVRNSKDKEEARMHINNARTMQINILKNGGETLAKLIGKGIDKVEKKLAEGEYKLPEKDRTKLLDEEKRKKEILGQFDILV